MIGEVGFSIREKIMYGDIVAKKLVVNPEKKKFPIVGKAKAISGFFKGIIEMVSQWKISITIRQLIQITTEYHFVRTMLKVIYKSLHLDGSRHKSTP